jgi:cohesin complex subunit SCC1
MLREAIKDATDLVRKRRKAPHTHLDTWKVAKVGSLPYTFLDPMIPCRSHIHASLDAIIDVNFTNSVCPLILTDKTSISLARVSAPEAPENSCEESIRARRRLSYEHTESFHSCKDTGSTERETILDASRRRKLDEWTDIEAPVGCHTESRPVQDGVCECDEDTAKEKGTQVEGDEPSSEIPPKKGLRESESRPVQDGVCECNEALNDQTDFEAYVSCRTESEPVQGGVCECHEDTAEEKGTQIKGDEPSSEIPPKKGLHESENQILLHNEALNAALDNIDEVSYCMHQTHMIRFSIVYDENCCIEMTFTCRIFLYMMSTPEMKVIFINCYSLCCAVDVFVLSQALICTLLFCRFAEFN